MRTIALDTKAKIITISSGKGGVGKTCASVNLSILLAQQGYKVCLFDADANLANVNIMLKLIPEFTLEHVLSGEKSLNDITLHKAGLHIIPGASGITSFVSLAVKQQQRLIQSLQEMKNKYDYLIIDNPAGISENVLSYIKLSNYGIIVITPEPTSLTDAFALIRVLQKRGNKKTFNVIVNNVNNKIYGYGIFKRFLTAVKNFIGCEVNFLGSVISDELVSSSVCLQNPVVLQYPTSHSTRNFNEISRKLISLAEQHPIEKPISKTQKIIPKQQPNFSTNAATLNKNLNVKQAESSILSPEKLKAEFIQKIKDKKIDKSILKEALQEINNAYTERFGDYVTDFPQIIHDAIKMEHISKNTLKHLTMTLHSLYQDQYNEPIEVQESSTKSKQNNLAQETAEKLIRLLEQENSLSLQQDNVPLKLKRPKLVPSSEKPRNIKHELLDSIRYASMVDKK